MLIADRGGPLDRQEGLSDLFDRPDSALPFVAPYRRRDDRASEVGRTHNPATRRGMIPVDLSECQDGAVAADNADRQSVLRRV